MKLSLKKIVKLLEREGYGRPEGPSPANRHHYHKHAKGDYGDFQTWGTKKYPFVGDKDDLESGVDAAGAGENFELEQLPEIRLREFFKFTQSASDNTSFRRPPTMGAGAMGAYGKTNKEMEDFDPSDADNEKRFDVFDGRMDTKVKKMNEFAGPGLRQRHSDRGGLNISTKQPWASGLPGHGPKTDDLEGEEEIEDFLDEGSKYADTNYDKMVSSRIARSPHADLDFFDKYEQEHPYLMNSDLDIKRNNKKNKKKR